MKRNAGQAESGIDDMDRIIARCNKEAPKPRKPPELTALPYAVSGDVGKMHQAAYDAQEEYEVAIQWRAKVGSGEVW